MAQNSFKRICLMDFSLDSDGRGDIGDRLSLYPRASEGEGEGILRPRRALSRAAS